MLIGSSCPFWVVAASRTVLGYVVVFLRYGLGRWSPVVEPTSPAEPVFRRCLYLAPLEIVFLPSLWGMVIITPFGEMVLRQYGRYDIFWGLALLGGFLLFTLCPAIAV